MLKSSLNRPGRIWRKSGRQNAKLLLTAPLAWHYDAINKFLYVRVALVDYRMITVFPIAWFLPQGYATALINDLYKGGMVLVRVKTQ